MPILITLLLGAMAAFYFYGKPKSEGEKTAGATLATTDDAKTPPTSPVPAAKKETPAAKVESKHSASLHTASDLPAPDVEMGRFTPWMSPDDLDAWVKKQNDGHTVSFWQRGHWITAVEGRWEGESHQFRIAFDTTPQLQNWRWQYRVNQTPEEFMQNSNDLQTQGYRMVQVQSFDHPDKRRRYQAVWEKTTQLGADAVSHAEVIAEEEQAPTVAAATVPTPTSATDVVSPTNSSSSIVRPLSSPESLEIEPRSESPATESSALDVNRLQFR